MNILQVIASGGLGGRELQPIKLGIEMRKRGENIFFLVKKNSQTIPLLKKYNFPYLEIKLNGYLNLLSIKPVIKYLKNNKIDIIHTHISKSLLFLIICKKLSKRKIKLIFTHRMGVGVKKDDIFHRYVYKNTDEIVVISKYVQKRFEKASPFLKNRFKLIYDGVNLPDLKKNDKKRFQQEFHIKRNELTIGLIAQINPGKGHKWLIKSLSYLETHYKIKNYKLFFIGIGELIPEIKELIKKLNLIQKVIFTGFREDVDYFYRNLDIIIVPSKNEALGNVLEEALSFKKPVICTNSGAFPEIIKNKKNGLLVPYNNIEELAKAIYTLIKNKKLKEKISKNGRETIKKYFHFKKSVDEYLKLYKY